MAEKKTQIDIGDISGYLKKIYRDRMPDAYKFHNFSYLKSVVKQAKKMAKALELTASEKEILLAANWFRYSGMIKQYENYEIESTHLAAEYLQSQNWETNDIDRVKKIILNSTSANKPTDTLEEITQDAGLAYLGKSKFFSTISYLKLELENTQDKKIGDRKWHNIIYKKLSEGQFYTAYANEKYQDKVADHLTKQQKNLKTARRDDIRIKTGKEFGRGIDTLYRSTYRTHINLSSIADGKANMMISINTIVLSAIITLIGTTITLNGKVSFDHFRFFLPILILLVTVLGSAVFAILSANPKVTSSDVEKKDIVQRTKSVLFFGNFIHMEQEKFVENLGFLKNNEKLLYDNMAVDIYELGQVLSTKYKMIKISYNIFMVGLILCVASFLIILCYSQYTAN